MSKNLKDILTEHLQGQQEPGLLLLTLPTGFGKTHYVTDYLAEHLREGFPQRVWFITNLKKNLPLESLRKKVGEQIFQHKVAFLNSYVEQASLFFSQQDLPAPFKDWKSAQALRRQIEAYAGCSSTDFRYRDYLQEQASQAEQTFRRELRQYLNQHFSHKPRPEERLSAIKAERNLRWIPELYPSVAFFEKQVFFCSIDKFLRYIDTIIGPNLQMANPELLRQSIIFIDEFDATKANVQQAIIENAVRFNQDIISLFASIHSGLHARSFSEAQLAGVQPEWVESLLRQYEEVKERSKELHQRYQLGHHYYYAQEQTVERAFLFHDFEYHTVIEQSAGFQPRFLAREHQPDQQLNQIRVLADKPATEQDNILYFLNDLRGGIYAFVYFIHRYATSYKESHDRQSHREEISLENAIRTALDWFDLKDSKTQDYFIDFIFQQISRQSVRSGEIGLDLSPVSQGFRYYDILNHKSHDATSRILYTDTLTTPEAWLLQLCRHAQVVGMAATAGLDSPLSNYALAHLRHHLGERFYELGSADQALLHAEHASKNARRSQADIRLVPLSSPSKKLPALEALLPDPSLAKHFAYLFAELQDHQVERYVKTARAYQYFLEQEDIHSLLCLLNKFPKKNLQDDFQEGLLRELFAAIYRLCRPGDETDAKRAVEASLYVISSQGFDEQLSAVRERLEAGQRIFLLSTYSTMGAGQNIQYRAPESVPVVPINDLDYGAGEKDFDAIYLEKPTHLLFWLQQGEDMTPEHLLQYLFEVEYLSEGGGISPREKAERIKAGFHRRLRSYPRLPSNQPLQERRCVVDHHCRVLIQAVGRLSRTRLRSPITHILFDEKIQPMVARFQKGAHLLTPEFEALLAHCSEGGQISEATDTDAISIDYQNRHHSLALAAHLRRLARSIGKWNDNTITYWNKLREFALRHPTLTEEQARKTGLQKYYLRHPEGKLADHYFYRTGRDDDFRRHLELSFSQNIGAEVSSEAARLGALLEVPGVRALFEARGYAQAFTPAAYILSPPLFKNIYLGALGEAIGCHLLEQHLGRPLQALAPGEYELFDFKWSDGCYIDFKHWSATTVADAESEHENIAKKMQKLGARTVLVINLVKPLGDYRRIDNTGGIIEIPGLIDLEQRAIHGEAIQFIHKILTDHE
jgi:hypothetical protein